MNFYCYKAKLRAVNGETVDLDIDLGFSIRYAVRFRLARINMFFYSFRGALYGTDYLIDLLTMFGDDAIRVQVITGLQDRKTDEYGRWTGEIFIDPGDGSLRNVSDAMVDAGFAEYCDD